MDGDDGPNGSKLKYLYAYERIRYEGEMNGILNASFLYFQFSCFGLWLDSVGCYS